MERRGITVPEPGIARGAVVECEAYDLVGGRIVKSDHKLPVTNVARDGVQPGFAIAVQVGGDWVVEWSSC